jgi:hypothetical protein
MFSSLDWLPQFRWISLLVGVPPKETGFQQVHNFDYSRNLTYIEENDINVTIQRYNIPNGIIKRHFGTYMTSDTNSYTITSL